jgi:hypothetical protein
MNQFNNTAVLYNHKTRQLVHVVDPNAIHFARIKSVLEKTDYTIVIYQEGVTDKYKNIPYEVLRTLPEAVNIFVPDPKTVKMPMLIRDLTGVI